MSYLTTVPSFVFYQGEIGEPGFELPIEVEFWNGSISLRQQGSFDEKECINISPEHLNELFKQIKKFLPEANEHLKKP